MNNDVNFLPLGYVKGNINSLKTSITCVETEQEWCQLWDKIKGNRSKADEPVVDFENFKVVIISAKLSSISNDFVVKKIEKVANEILVIECGQVYKGSGLGLAAYGTINQFVLIDNSVSFKETRIQVMKEKCLEEFDADLDFVSEEVTDAEDRLAELMYDRDKARDKLKELEQKGDDARNRFTKLSTQYSKELAWVQERLTGGSLV